MARVGMRVGRLVLWDWKDAAAVSACESEVERFDLWETGLSVLTSPYRHTNPPLGQATPGDIGTLTEEMQSLATSDYRGSNQAKQALEGLMGTTEAALEVLIGRVKGMRTMDILLGSRSGSVMTQSGMSTSGGGAFRSLNETDLKRANAALSQATREGKQFRIRQDIPRLSFDASFHDPNEAVATNSGGHPTPILESDDAFGIPTDIPDVPGDTAPDADVDQDSALVEQVSLLVHDKTINLTALA
ncbi:hypothetical protein C8J56DRAFT_905769 [Mycena floridula]|nr:hypothetical protein C8J56DRAFT_905769 [Mycena floridula]